MKVNLYDNRTIIETFEYQNIPELVDIIHSYLMKHSKYGNFKSTCENLIGFEKVEYMINNGGLHISVGGNLMYSLVAKKIDTVEETST